MTTPARRALRSSLGMLLAFLVVVIGASFVTERDSCLRSGDIRAASQTRGSVTLDLLLAQAADAERTGATASADHYKRLAARIEPLQMLTCGLPWPQTPDKVTNVKPFTPYTLPKTVPTLPPPPPPTSTGR